MFDLVFILILADVGVKKKKQRIAFNNLAASHTFTFGLCFTYLYAQLVGVEIRAVERALSISLFLSLCVPFNLHAKLST